jgi:hypothetical protein
MLATGDDRDGEADVLIAERSGEGVDGRCTTLLEDPHPASNTTSMNAMNHLINVPAPIY